MSRMLNLSQSLATSAGLTIQGVGRKLGGLPNICLNSLELSNASYRRRRHGSTSFSTGSVIHSSCVILEAAVTPRPDLDDFRRDSLCGTIAVGFGVSCRDSVFSADLACVPVAIVNLVHNSAVSACFATFALRRQFLGPGCFFFGANCRRPSSRDC